jgi:curved DNA-binding protein CbpA
MSINFNNLKYNLYHLLNVDISSPYEEISRSFRRIIKKFHPDKAKLTELENELYYEITLANHILSSPNERKKYDMFLRIVNNNNNNNNNNPTFDYSSIKKDIQQHMPETKEKAYKQYIKDNDYLYNRHNFQQREIGNLNEMLKNKNKERDDNYQINRVHFRDTDEFNNTFVSKKKNGNYNTDIVQSKKEIQPYQLTKSSIAMTDLKDFNNMFSTNIVRNKDMTSLSEAFVLQAHIDVNENFDYGEKINNYENTTFNTENNFNF